MEKHKPGVAITSIASVPDTDATGDEDTGGLELGGLSQEMADLIGEQPEPLAEVKAPRVRTWDDLAICAVGPCRHLFQSRGYATTEAALNDGQMDTMRYCAARAMEMGDMRVALPITCSQYHPFNEHEIIDQNLAKSYTENRTAAERGD